MKLTIDNHDGAGARDYTAALDGEHPVQVRRRLNRPTEMQARLVTDDPQFVVPAAGGRVVVERGGGDKVFTGYLTAAPEYEYLGWGERGPAYRFALAARSDEWLLERTATPRRSEFINRSAGSALKQLAEDVLPGEFDVSGVEDVEILPWYASDPQKSFSEQARELAVRARASYRAHDGALRFGAVGGRELEVDETAADFQPEGLKLASPRGVMNDVAVTGYVEPQAQVKDYFLGDGYALRFNLSEVPFSRGGAIMLDEEYKDPLLRETYWSVSDPSQAVAVSGGKLQVDGGTGVDGETAVRFAEQMELGGALVLQHGDVSFNGASEGIIGGLYAGTVALANCLAGFRITPAGAQSTIAALINGSLAGTTITTVAGHRYVLTTRVYASEIYRRRQTFHSSAHPAGSGRGGETVAADLRLILEVHDIDPNNPPSLVAPATVLYDGVVPQGPDCCTYALINAAAMHCSVAFTRLLRGADPQVRTCLPAHNYRSRLVGALSEGAECYVSSTGEMGFFSPYVPAVNEKITVSYRGKGRAGARMSDPASIAAEAGAGDSGVRSALWQIVAPAARTSEDCEEAARALLDDTTSRAWAGQYETWSDALAGDVWPGDAVAVSAPSRGGEFSAIVREVEMEALDPAGDHWRYRIGFANDAAEPLGFELEAGTSDLPQVTPITNTSGATFMADLPAAEVTDITSTSVTVDMGVDAPAGGGFEVRRSDAGWGAENDRNLLGRFTTRTFTLARLARAQGYYVRQYDGAAPPRYSRHSTLLHIDYPL